MTQIADRPGVQGQDSNYWENRALKAERERDEYKEKCAELASELYWLQEWLANPNVTDKEKAGVAVYYQTIKSTKPREDGSRYYSRARVADNWGNVRTDPTKQGNKEQAFSPIHTLLKKSGLIKSTPESQKNDKSKVNYFDVISPQLENNPRSVVLVKEEAKPHGGKRVPFHRECGGHILERTVYTCTKCGEDHISEKNIIRVDEEKLHRWAEEDMNAVAQEHEPITEPTPVVQEHHINRSVHAMPHMEPNPEHLEPIILEPMKEIGNLPIQLPIINHPEPEKVKIPRCQHWQCATGPNRTQLKPPSMGGGFYCPVHHGYIDAQGRPL